MGYILLLGVQRSLINPLSTLFSLELLNVLLHYVNVKNESSFLFQQTSHQFIVWLIAAAAATADSCGHKITLFSELLLYYYQ